MSDLLEDFTNALDCCGTCAGGVLARHTERAVNEALTEAAIQMSGVGSHRDPCRLPDTPCLCGVCDFREEAARKIRARTT